MKRVRFTMAMLMALTVGGLAAGVAPGKGAPQQDQYRGAPAAISPLVRTVDLDMGKTQEVELADGSKTRVKLLGGQESRDPLRRAVREAQVTVAGNGVARTLVSALYHRPVTVTGVPQAVPVITGPRAEAVEKVAAQELAWYLKRLYPDCDFPLRRERPTAGREILVGTPGSWRELARFVPREQLASAESFRVLASGETGVIAGADPRGVLFGVYALLEKLGCGFFLSSESVPEPEGAPFDFSSWSLEDRPLFADRIVFDWHNFLSSASSWELEDWQQYLSQAAKMRFNTLMLHAYGNNPMFTFQHNGQTKPVGYAATTRSGRDWGTQHVNDVRRLVGGEVFPGPVFGSSIGLAPEDRRAAAATELMQKVFAFARSRGLHVTFALDVDTESANPQNIIRTLPAAARMKSGAFELANPDTPEGFAYYQDQIRQLLETYPEIDRLAVWFRTGRTPWRNLKPEQFPPDWKHQFDVALEEDPWLRDDADAPGMFVMGKLLRTFERVLRELGRTEVELAAGSWRLPFLRAADYFFPRAVPLIPLDWETIFDTEKGQQQLRQVRSGRKLIPIVWAHHDDRTYIGRPYKPYEHFASQLRANGGTGFGIIHWTTRPLDLYFRSLAEQVWQSTADRPLAETCADFAARAFGPTARTTGGRYLLEWLNGAPMFGRETSNRFMDAPLPDFSGNMNRFAERLSLLEQIDGESLSPPGRERLAYYRDYERFMQAFFESQAALDRASQLLKKDELQAARDELAKCHPEEVIQAYVQAATRDRISRGEQALIVSLNLRWRPYVVSLRQALGLEPVRIKFQPTQHEPLAQGAGTNTFYVDRQHQLWQGLGEKETGCPTFQRPGEADVDELRRSGLRIEKPVTLQLGAMVGGKLTPGRYTVSLLFAPPSTERSGVAELELRGSSAEAGMVRSSVDPSTLRTNSLESPAYEVPITDGQLTLTIRPRRGTVFVSGVLIGSAGTGTEAPGQRTEDGGQRTKDGAVPHRSLSVLTAFPGREWLEATPESQGLDSAKLRAAVDYMEANFGPEGAKELAIVRNGRLIWQGPDCDAYHNIWSATKPFTSTVLGVLVGEAKCRLDDLAIKYLPHLADEHPAYARITLRQLASMSSGYMGKTVNVSEEQPWGDPMAYLTPDKPLYEPGTQVQYNDKAIFLLGSILTRLAGQSEKAVFQSRIAEPIGMTRWEWGVSGQVDGIPMNNAPGTPNTPGIQTTARELARFGLLYLNGGNWNGRQLLPASFVEEAGRNQAPEVGQSAFLHGRMGYFWWTNDIMPNGKRPWPSAPPRAYTAHGHSANFCYVIPEWNMVVVRLGTQPIAPGVRGITETEAKWDSFFAKLAQAFVPAACSASRTRVSIRDGRWLLNDEVTYPGTPAEGLLMNVRMVNAVFEDRQRPDFDPNSNTDEFLAQIPDYLAHGIRAFTVCLQGGSTGYEGALNSAFNPDGSLRDAYLARVRRVIEACDRHGAVVILGCYYQRQDQVLQSEAAVRAGVVNVARWIAQSGFTNVVLEVANEFGHSGFDHRVLKRPEGITELIELAQRTAPGLLVSASSGGQGQLPDNVAGASDFLLIHFNNTRVADIPSRISALKQLGKPIVCNEDDKVSAEGVKAAEACVANGASWGFMHVAVNQHFPFTFQGAADDPAVYASLRRMTSPGAVLARGDSVEASGLGDGPAHREDARLRLIIETDAGGDPDDEQSLVRFLLYANEWDVEGIIPNRPVTRRPENKNPKDTGLDIVRRLLDAYGQCRPRLVQHDPRYPTEEYLWQRTVAGYNGTDDAVNLIIAAVDKDDPRPLWYSDWGTDNGAAVNNLKRALDRVLRERGPEGYAQFKSRLRLSSADKFAEHTTSIAPPFPIWVNTFQPAIEGKRWYHRFSALTSKAGGFDLKRDVLTGHGPLGALYPTNTSLWAKEGDTMTFLYLVPTGMNDPNEPLWGSWAGRYGPNENFPDKRYYWANQSDAWNDTTNRDNTLARWAADLQNDFRTRLEWCVKTPDEVNHVPQAAVNGSAGKEILRITAQPGQEVSLDAGGTRDRDGDTLAYDWFVYREAGTYQGEVALTEASSSRAVLHVPNDAGGRTLHVVLAVHDNGTPPLAAYRRIIVQVPAVRSVPVRASGSPAAPVGELNPGAGGATTRGSTTNEYFPPPESQGGWRMLDKAEDIRQLAGSDPAKLEDLKEWLLRSDKRSFAAVVIRRGYIVLQVERGNSARTDSRRVASVSKAVCATVLAIASEQSQKGLTPVKMTFDDPAFQFIPWARPLSDPRKAQITVKQLLNHTSGLCPEALGAPNDGTWEYILGLSGDPRTARLAFDPGTACGYSTHALCHAALVCETVTGKPYDQFAIEALFKPLGIEHWWFQYANGGDKIGRHPTHGLGMPARDLARIAYCMLQEGRWGDRQVIPKWFVDQTGRPSHDVHTPEMRWKLNPQTFTLGWELPALRGDGIPADARYKPGSGGQLIAFVPSLDLVITRQTGSSGEWAYEEYVRRASATVLPGPGVSAK